jgi:hypothetical protein
MRDLFGNSVPEQLELNLEPQEEQKQSRARSVSEPTRTKLLELPKAERKRIGIRGAFAPLRST